MYKEHSSSDIRAMFKVLEEYQVDALLTFGTHPKSKEYRFFEEALAALGISVTYEPIQNEFFGEIKSLVTPYGRLWFDVIYGCAYASELIHVASLLGTKAIIHVGGFGAVQSDIQPRDIVLPDRAYGNESTTRMYARTQTPPFFSAHRQLRTELAEAVGAPVRGGSIVSIQAMLAETPEDVAMWQKKEYAGVEMECASMFAVAEHFGVPAAAALYAADNLTNNILVTDTAYAESKLHRQAVKHSLYVAALKTLFNRMRK